MTPTDAAYATESGRTLLGGQYPPAWPSWRRAQTANTWVVVPGNTIASINPENNAAINPNYPSSSPWRGITGQTALVTAWNGMSYDKTLDEISMPLGGGHGDYGGNENYWNLLGVDTPTWRMPRNPSGAVGNLITLNDGQEAAGVYADGRLRAIHNYNNILHVPGVGHCVVRQSGKYIADGPNGQRLHSIDRTTGEATLILDWNSLSITGSPYGGSCYDSLRNCIYTIGVGNTPMVKINLNTLVASVVVSSNNYVGAYAKLVYLAAYDLVAVFQSSGTGYPQKFYLFDPSNSYAQISPTLTGSFSSGFTFNGQIGADWDDTAHKFYLWNNSTSTTEISTLAPSGNPRTQSWVESVLSVDGSNAVTPTAMAANQTYGRFAHSPNLGGCWLLNAVGESIRFFALE